MKREKRRCGNAPDRRHKGPGSAVARVLTASAAVAGLAFALRRADIHLRMGGLYGPIVIRTMPGAGGRDRLRIMTVEGACQGATYLGERRHELPFAYMRAFDRIFEANPGAKRIAVLGGGAFCYPKHLLDTGRDVEIDTVEADFQTIRAAMDFFFLDEAVERAGERLRIFEREALPFLLDEGPLYDAIVNDAYAGAVPDRALASAAGMRAVKGRLAPGGLYLANVAAYPARRDYLNLERACAAARGAFAYVNVFPCSDEDYSDEENYLVVASDAPYRFEGAIEARV